MAVRPTEPSVATAAAKSVVVQLLLAFAQCRLHSSSPDDVLGSIFTSSPNNKNEPDNPPRWERREGLAAVCKGGPHSLTDTAP